MQPARHETRELAEQGLLGALAHLQVQALVHPGDRATRLDNRPDRAAVRGRIEGEPVVAGADDFPGCVRVGAEAARWIVATVIGLRLGCV